MTRRYSVEDWRRAVYRDPHISDGTKVLLLLLSEDMRADLKVSIPRGTLARKLNRSERRLADRFKEAIGEGEAKTPGQRRCQHEHRLLDRVVRGQKHVQAVYQGLVPEGLSVTHVCPAEMGPQHDAQEHAEIAGKCHGENADTGPQQDTRGSCLTRAEPSRGLGFTDGSKGESDGTRLRLPAADCQWHRDDTCPPDCANAPEVDADRRRSA